MKSRSFKSIFNVCVLFVLVMASFAMPSSITQAAPLSANPLAAACGIVSFSTAVNFSTGSSPRSVAVGDFNGDGKPDLAVANTGSSNVSVLLGNGAGSFGAATNFVVGANPFSVAVGDFNGDGKQDLATANFSGGNVSVLLGNGAGSFGAATNFGAGTNPISVAVGDFNGDGKPDLAVANSGSDNVSVLLGDGAGSFGTATNFAMGLFPYSVAVGDFNGDGKPDLATANSNSANISVLLNNCDASSPTVLSHTLLASNATSPASFTVTFSEDVSNPAGDAGTDDVTNPSNYKIINKGANGTVDTASCASGVGGDDTLITPSGLPNPVTYVPNTVIINIGSTLPAGSYRLFVCGSTSIVDLAGNPLAGDGITSGTDFTFDFTVGAATASTRTGNKTTASTLPKTGFAPNKITTLPAQPATLAYAKLGDLWLEIPSLNVKSTIVGVPQNKDNSWDVSWLGNDTGWLNGTAFPTWNGNSVLTAHVVNASGLDGPFAALKSLKYGDQVIVHFGGVKYVYEVRETKLTRPYSTSFAFESKRDASYLTLITCSGYNPLNESYLFRRVVRAVLVSVVNE